MPSINQGCMIIQWKYQMTADILLQNYSKTCYKAHLKHVLKLLDNSSILILTGYKFGFQNRFSSA